jgi:two-component system cell cycle sensor histidine kinase/response regulator CckA
VDNSNDLPPPSEHHQHSLDPTRLIGQDLKYVLASGWRAVERLSRHIEPGDSDLAELRQALAEADHLAEALLHRTATVGVELPPLDVDAFLSSIESNLESMLGLRTTLSLRLGALDGVVLAERSDLEVILEQLVIASIRAIPAGGDITISTGWLDYVGGSSVRGLFWPRRHIRLTVSDTGEGHYVETCQRVLQSSSGQHGAERAATNTVAEIVGRLGGYLIIESTLGEGSRIHVCLPAAPAPSES